MQVQQPHQEVVDDEESLGAKLSEHGEDLPIEGLIFPLTSDHSGVECQ